MKIICINISFQILNDIDHCKSFIDHQYGFYKLSSIDEPLYVFHYGPMNSLNIVSLLKQPCVGLYLKVRFMTACDMINSSFSCHLLESLQFNVIFSQVFSLTEPIKMGRFFSLNISCDVPDDFVLFLTLLFIHKKLMQTTTFYFI